MESRTRNTALAIGLTAVFFARPCYSQVRGAFGGQNAEQIFGRGYTDKELDDERKLLNDRNKKITWDNLPLFSYPHSLKQIDPGKVGSDKVNERLRKQLGEQQKRFVEQKLKGRKFRGLAVITRITEVDGKVEILARESGSRGKVDEANPFARERSKNHSRYICTWAQDSVGSLKKGATVVVDGRIVDLREDAEPTLTLRDAIIADRDAQPSKKK